MTKILKEKNGNITLKVYQDVTEVQEDQKTTAIQERVRVRDLTNQDIDRLMRSNTKI